MKKLFFLGSLAFAAALPSVNAQTVAQTPDEAITAVEARVDKVGGVGAKAYIIAGGLALAGVIIGFIRKAKR